MRGVFGRFYVELLVVQLRDVGRRCDIGKVRYIYA